jgi:guanylate kinase
MHPFASANPPLDSPAKELSVPANPSQRPAAPGRLIVISGPSGVGKTTLLKRLFERCPDLNASVSATTRPPRAGEANGVDYFFLPADEFQARRARGEFLECFEVFGLGYWYGTLRDQVTPSLAAGKWVVLEIDVQGAMSVLSSYPEAITIFVRPGSAEELERRLRGRGAESEEAMQRRLAVARRELSCADKYRYQVLNEDVGRAVQEICDILQSEGK